ncbi:MAG TPA: DUF1206 domain-containing protein [Miltoncostaeaceae bacterium]|nr:DUF1206 domain-containing protein [Miltoncostaeaceae bacterium]
MSVTTAPRRTAKRFTNTLAFEALARSGYVARGLLYVIIGYLAIRLAEGQGTQPPGQQGALRTIESQPGGRALLVAMAVGLGAYALWRIAEGFVGETPEAGRHSAFERIGAVASGIAYAVFCLLAVDLLRGSSTNSSQGPSKAASGVMGWTGGRELVGAAGVVLLSVAAYQAYYGLSRRFLEDSKAAEMHPAVRKGFTAVGMVGITARAVAFALIGIFILKAAIDYKPREAVGLDGALARLASHSSGTVLLIVVACGLIAFGVYSLADARFRKI